MTTEKKMETTPQISINDCDPRPKFWDDDMKMEAWFAPFRNRDLNPLNYDNKMAFWKSNVDYFCSQTHKCYFTLNQLKKFFVRNGKSPLCLAPVLESMISEAAVQDLAEYETSMSNNTWVGWAVNKLVSNPLRWSLKKVTDVVSPTTIEIDENTEYMHMPSLKRQSEELFKCVSSEGKDKIYVYDELIKLYSLKIGAKIDLKIIKLLVHNLELENKACVYFENKHCHCHLIKFRSDVHVSPTITETEISIYILQNKENALIDQLQKMEAEKDHLQEEVKNFLKQKMRNLAKNTLRKQKEVEKRITKLMNVLENIQNLLYRVQDTEADSQILESYKVGADALKSKINKNGLNLDNVDNTMDEIEKALDIHNDIQETLGQPVGPQNEADLENELAELLIDDMPFVPPEPPSPGRKTKDSTKIEFEDLPDIPDSLLRSIVDKNSEKIKV